jgi:2-dehydropantoate 2-reductase
VGVGAVGGLYGARLAGAGYPVRFVARSDAAHLRQHGLVLESPWGDLQIGEPDVYDDPRQVPVSDIVIVALKTTENERLPSLLGPMLGPQTSVVFLQNGLGIEEGQRGALGDRALLGGLCFVCSNKVGPGHVRHLDYGRVVLAADRDRAEVASAVADDFTAAGIPASVEDDLALARWKKLVWNVPFNGLSVVLDALPQDVLADPHGRSLVAELMSDVQRGALACGKKIDDDFLTTMIDDTVAMRPYLTSMKLDFDSGRPMEVEAIFGNPVRAARAEGVELAAIDALYRQLAYLDAHRR